MNFKKILDIGCGFGAFVDLFDSKNVEAYGIESNKNTVTKSKSPNVIHAKFDDSFSDSNFDLIAIHQSLYYFENSIDILNKCNDLLNKNGIIFIATTNMESSIRKDFQLWTQGCKMCLSKKNFSQLNGLELVDFTSYTDLFYRDFLFLKEHKITKTRFTINLILYFLKIKSLCMYEENGMNNFILLKKS